MKHFFVHDPFMPLSPVAIKRAAESCKAEASGFYSVTPEQSLARHSLAVKDVFDIVGLPTTGGNPDWAKSHKLPVKSNSTVVKLLAAGASLVGKTITDELAYSLNGQNMHYGTPQSPIDPTRLPGGSSSGSAVAVAAGLADIGLGTDTAGSIRVPASYNGLFGLRPSHAALPCDNMLNLAPSFDTTGWMTASLKVMHSVTQHLLPNLAQSIPEQIVIATLDSFIQKAAHAKQINSFLSMLEQKTDRDASHKIGLSKIPDAFNNVDLGQVFIAIQGAEVWREFGDWFCKDNPLIAEDIAQRLQASKNITELQVLEAQKVRNTIQIYTNNILAEADAIVLPTTPGIAPPMNANQTQSLEESNRYRKSLLNLTAIASLCGLPQLHLPLFKIDDARCGISLIGKAGSELQLINIAKIILETHHD